MILLLDFGAFLWSAEFVLPAAQHCARAFKTINPDLKSTVENLRQKTAQILSDSLSNSEVPSPTERPSKDPPRHESMSSSPAQPIQMVFGNSRNRLLSIAELFFISQIYYGVPEQRYDVNWSPFKPPANAIAAEPDWKRAYIPLMVRHLFSYFDQILTFS